MARSRTNNRRQMAIDEDSAMGRFQIEAQEEEAMRQAELDAEALMNGRPTAGDVPVPTASDPTDESREATLEMPTLTAQTPTQERKVTMTELSATTDVFDFGSAPTATRRKKGTPMPCLCGCGEETKSFFAMGHDARLKSRIQHGLVDPSVISVENQTKLIAKSDSWVAYFNGEITRHQDAKRSEKNAKTVERMLAAEMTRQQRETRSQERKAARQAAEAAMASTKVAGNGNIPETDGKPRAAKARGAAGKQETQRKLTASQRQTADERESLLAAMQDMRAQGLLDDDEDETVADDE